MSREVWARHVLGLTDESLLREQPEWVQGVEGLDAGLWPTYWDELEGSPDPASRKTPAAQLIRSPQDSEEVAASWLQYFGFFDAVPTPPGADGGVDVEGTDVVAQVKAEAKPTGRSVIQQTYGIAASRGAAAVVFSLAGFTPQAVQWADGVGVALFRFDLQGEPGAQNSSAEALIDEAERAVRRQADREPVEIGPFGSERVKNALSQMVIKAMDTALENLTDDWFSEEMFFDAIDTPPFHLRTDRDTRITNWRGARSEMKRVATELIGLARLMEALDLPFRLDPVLPRLLFILFEPDLCQVSMGTAQRDGEKVRRWIKVRSAYGADCAERFKRLRVAPSPTMTADTSDSHAYGLQFGCSSVQPQSHAETRRTTDYRHVALPPPRRNH